jgi:hypothetical protein
MTNIYGKGKKGKATKLHSLVIRTIGMCERCGDSEYEKLQCAHIISRKYNATRTDLRNAFCLCATCHSYFTDHPADFGRFVAHMWAGRDYDLLHAKAQKGQKGSDAFWDDRIVFLESVLRSIEAGEMTPQEAREFETA